MKKLLLILLFFSCPILLFAQINLDTKNKKINFFKALEVKNKSVLIKDKSHYLNNEQVYQPIIYQRKKEKDLPDLLVYYFYFKRDSTISYILYEWEDKSDTVMALSQTKTLYAKYNELLAPINEKFGKSETEGNLRDSSDLAYKDYLRRSDQWRNDSTNIQAYVVLSNKHPLAKNIRVLPTHTIRLFVGSPFRQKGSFTMSRDEVAYLDTQAKLFLTDICAGNFDSLRKYITHTVASRVKDEQLDKLKDVIKNEMWDLDQSRKQFTFTGKPYTTLRYIRHGDTAKPPLEVLSILFDDDDKIVTVQPSKGSPGD
jgi:hypothetical protein